MRIGLLVVVGMLAAVASGTGRAEPAASDVGADDLSVRGEVLDAETGRPLTDFVAAEEISINHRGFAGGVRVAAGGRFEAAVLAARRVRQAMLVTAPGYLPYQRYIDLGAGVAPALTISMHRSRPVRVHVRLPARAEILSATIRRWQPAEGGATVTRLTAEGELARTTSDVVPAMYDEAIPHGVDRGAVLERPTAGFELTVRATVDGAEIERARDFVVPIPLPPADVDGATTVLRYEWGESRPVGVTWPELDAQRAPPASRVNAAIRVRVTSEGQSADGARVTAYVADFIVTGTTDPDGVATLAIPTGASVRVAAYHRREADDRSLRATGRVAVAEGEAVEIDLALGPWQRATARFQTTDDPPHPIAGARIHLPDPPADAAGPRPVIDTHTDAFGIYNYERHPSEGPLAATLITVDGTEHEITIQPGRDEYHPHSLAIDR